ncbi:Highly similar to Ta1-3 polyprotein [Arabidopsis thaliana]|uniref:F28L22.3 protein n=1 Tax=Arabidopsis thaliana TaxID=3702 RepID=Q9SHR5_ARATH|nr:Highly similar to Ta1-3 polyprotein [Arabidopsis thaliana]
MATTTTRVEIKVFNGDRDFSLWKIRIQAQLGVLGLKDTLTDFSLTKTVPLTKSEAKQESGDGESSGTKEVPDPVKIEQSEQAKNIIINHISDVVLLKVNHYATTADLWATLNKKYMETSLPNRIYTQLKLYSFKMVSTMTIDQNVDEFLRIVAELGSLEIQVDEEVQAILILNSLPASHIQLKHTLKYGNKTLTVQDVTSSAKSLERELAEAVDLDKGQAAVLYTTERGRPLVRNNQKGGQGKGRSRSNSKTKVPCWYCKKEGHVKKDCYSRKKKMESEGQGEAGVITEKLVFSEALSVNEQMVKDLWILDSGCTSHMTSRRDWFISFQEKGNTTILLGDDHSVESQGQGTIRIDTHGGTIKILENVKYVPHLRRNLISTGTLDKLGYRHEGGEGKVRYFKNNKTALRGSLSNGLYVLDGSTVMSELCNAETDKVKTALWHSRLGHMSMNNLKVLAGKGLIDRKEINELEFCEHCVMGKSKKVSFNVGKHTSEDALSYVHADLWGSPNVTPSISGKQYFLSIIDDKTRKVWLYFLKSKDETFDKFCEWKSLVENQVNKKVKCLRTDNGLEFCNSRFDSYCKEHGIERHRTCTYTPQQNGVAERMNRTIMEKVRCLLNKSGVEEVFWAEAAATAAYLINRSPASAINHNVPEEMWLNRKPGYKHLRKFGSIAYVHQDQGKLKPRALKGFFLGYPAGTKGYKVWLLEEEKCVISRNVVFQESVVYRDLKVKEDDTDNLNQKETTSSEVEQNKFAEASGSGGVIQLQSDSEPITEGEQSSDSEEEVEYSEKTQETPKRTGLTTYKLARDRVRRNINPPTRFTEESSVTFALVVVENCIVQEPQSYQEAMESQDCEKWDMATHDEMDSLMKNGTWDLVDKPKDRKIIGCRWLFKLKSGIPGVEPTRFKARLVAKGYTQREGVDYQEIFAPVVKHVSIRILMSLVVDKDLELEQMDVKTTFLHGDLEEELYMEQPEGFVSDSSENKVCRLKKSLYGLKQSPRQWNKRFDRFMSSQQFIRSEHDACVYVKHVSEHDFIYLLLYVDDMLIAGASKAEINRVKEQLSTEFEMKDMGGASRILGIDIYRDRKGGVLKLSQEIYIRKVLDRFNMSGAKMTNAPVGAHFKLAAVREEDECVDTDVVPYSSAVGSIMYAMLGTRPDLAYAICLISRYMSKPGSMHWEAVKWVMRYLKGAQDLNLVFTKEKDFTVTGYCDSNYAADLDRRRSISGYVFTIGGNTVSWKASLQPVVAMSTTEAEYIALAEAAKEAMWIKGLLQDMGMQQDKVKIWCDSQSAICLSKNSVYHERTKHIDVRFNYIRDVVESGDVDVLKIHTSRNPVDALTKCIPVNKFKSALGVLKLMKWD